MTNDERQSTEDRRSKIEDRRSKIEDRGERRGNALSSILDPLSSILYRWSLVAALGLLLSGCLLTSGEQISVDAQPTGGNFSTTFVSAEGGAERTIQTGAGLATLNVIAAVRVQQGELRLEMLGLDGAVALAIQGRPDEQVTKIGKVPTDNEGNLHYRIVARGARNGTIEVLYQPLEP
ncbi:MAG TPA: hypothetical protein VFO07_01070 [Roseiflexaceae bacterium]|nr:hypothetical protein [Roseiflexaceae bacterium]